MEVQNVLKEWSNSHSLVFQVFEPPPRFTKAKTIFSEALLIVGPHGGMFANLNFAQPQSYVIEFVDWWITTQAFRPCYYGLSQANSLYYYYVKPENFDWDKRMKIDISKLKNVLFMVENDMKERGDL